MLSAFTHIWNPVGFPSIYIDENAYLQRAMIVLNGGGPRDTSFQYDHPYFAQLFLATIFRIIDYPNLLVHSSAPDGSHFIEMVYLVPRVLMGILAVVDTFLVYKISDRRYGRNVAFIASILFAVMPMTWFLRRIVLDSILMPFLLSSILFAIYTKDSKSITARNLIVLLSGVFLGLAIFTKVPAFTMIPLVAFLIYTNLGNRKLNVLGIWFIPVILIPLIWPAHALYIGEFDDWLNGVYYQTHRSIVSENLQSVTGIGSLFDTIRLLFFIDPLLMILGLAGVFFTAIKRDFMFLLWIVPLLIFLYFLGFVQYFYFIPIIPAFCIAAAKMISSLSSKFPKKYIPQRITKYFSPSDFSHGKFRRLIIVDRTKDILLRLFLPSTLPFTIISIIGIFGLISISLLVTVDFNSSYFSTLAFVNKYLSYNSIHSNTFKSDQTIISDLRYTWIPQYVTHENYNYLRFWESYPIRTEKVSLIFQDDFVKSFLTNTFKLGEENIRGDTVYNSTFQIADFKPKSAGVYSDRIYPYTSFSVNQVKTPRFEIRTNALVSNSSTLIFHINNGTKADQVNETLQTTLPTNQIKLPLFWIDPFKNCDHNFKCTGNLDTGWKDNTSLYLSTNTTNKDTWSGIHYYKQNDVNPDKQYQIVTHMKLNNYVIGSHVSLQGYNESSKSWYQLTTQCPSGTNGPLEWKEFRCNITIPAKTTKIIPMLNAGWSSEKGKEAVTLFDNISIIQPADWIDPLENCNQNFKCTVNSTTTGSQNNKTRVQLSTNTTNKDTWSEFHYNKPIDVNPGLQYQIVTHMKLNNYVIGSHVSLQGYNESSKSWYPLTTQCPPGTNGPLEWKEFRCNITIPAKTTKIIPVLNAGWSSEKGKEAVTLFDNISIIQPADWIDPLENCNQNFKCTVNSTTTGSQNNKTRVQLSTNTTNKNMWSEIYYNKPIDVNPGLQYQIVTHMKLNQYVTQSHVALQGYNESSKSWYPLTTQCPPGTNGPLEWKEFRCNITIPANTTKIIPVLNAGWSSEKGKEAVTLFDNISIIQPADWIDPLENCNQNFKCTVNSTTTGSQNNKTRVQLSTNTTNKNMWSEIYYNKPIDVNPGLQYQIVTHMKLNQYVTQSHVALQGYNESSKSWYPLTTQCPPGTNGPLEWKEFRCNITIPAKTTKIIPVLNAGWSSEKGKEAVTLFENMSTSNTSSTKISNSNQTNSNMISNPNFMYFDDGMTAPSNSDTIISICSLHGNFDVWIPYKILELPLDSGLKMDLIAQKSAVYNQSQYSPSGKLQQINGDCTLNPSGQLVEANVTHFNNGIHLTDYAHVTNSLKDMSGGMRIMRSGSTVTAYNYGFGKWIPVSTERVGQTDVSILLQASASHFGFEDRSVKVLIGYVNNK